MAAQLQSIKLNGGRSLSESNKAWIARNFGDCHMTRRIMEELLAPENLEPYKAAIEHYERELLVGDTEPVSRAAAERREAAGVQPNMAPGHERTQRRKNREAQWKKLTKGIIESPKAPEEPKSTTYQLFSQRTLFSPITAQSFPLVSALLRQIRDEER